MLTSFVERLRSTRVLKRGLRLLRAGEKEALAALAAAHEDPALGRPLQGLLAQCLAEDDDREGARAAFNRLHVSLKGDEDRDAPYLRLFALFHLALIRNSIPDAAFLSRKARALKADRRLRAYLPIPLLVAPPTPGPALTATV